MKLGNMKQNISAECEGHYSSLKRRIQEAQRQQQLKHHG